MKRNYLVNSLACCLFLLPLFSNAQSGNESPIPYFRYSATVGAGPTLLYGDSDDRKIGIGGYLRGNYFITHGLSIGLELQEGLLRSGGSMETENLYHGAILGAGFQPIKFFQDDHLRRIEYRKSWGIRALESVYAGAGIGALYNLQLIRTGSFEQNNNMGISYLVSTNLGLELPLHNLHPNLLDSYVWNLVVNAQANFALDDKVDRYNAATDANEHNDAYSLLTIGVNLRF
ncbi:hypothetical protein [Parapedobacter sp. DT-150]|uniref:hypothetical protein n=1 Tax=Parapedobacter sp. DT-150 TaxID=3396162 RepID=UPI003F19F984